MAKSHVCMTVEWHVPAAETGPITAALHALMIATRTARGCVGCSVSTGVGNSGAVRYTEEWQTEEDLRMRLRSDTFTRLASLIDDATKAPVVEFELPEGKRGLDFAEEIRRKRT